MDGVDGVTDCALKPTLRASTDAHWGHTHQLKSLFPYNLSIYNSMMESQVIGH